MKNPNEEAFEWIERALTQELPDRDRADVELLAFTLDAIAEEEGVPTEELIAWLHDGRGKAAEYSPFAWREHARGFAELQRRLGKVPQGS